MGKAYIVEAPLKNVCYDVSKTDMYQCLDVKKTFDFYKTGSYKVLIL